MKYKIYKQGKYIYSNHEPWLDKPAYNGAYKIRFYIGRKLYGFVLSSSNIILEFDVHFWKNK